MFHITTYLKMRKSGWKWITVSGTVSFEFPRIWFEVHIVFARQKTIFNTYGPMSLPSLGEIKMTSESNRLPKMLFYLFVCRPALICNVCIVEYDHENLHDQYLYILDVRFDLSNYTDGWERRPSAFILCMKIQPIGKQKSRYIFCSIPLFCIHDSFQAFVAVLRRKILGNLR